ncbi:helix-turn-helix domain-containing protein [Streptomyces sp. NRRL S-37]|uniref:helix-turn-helix domain-containing protein n=1 Tax=Streptomyces sp. NRRL S-37 TaxID=1463903 RepID=UPI0004C7F102|nr:helix-turn-helix domain-containing protein [Streptomyces sp. NRRL S-37]
MTRSPVTPLPSPDERRRLRTAASLTRRQVAECVGVRPETVRAWESGRGTPRGRNRKAYAKLLAGLAERAADGGIRESVPVHREEAAAVVAVRLGRPGGDGRPGTIAPEPSAFTQAPPPSSAFREERLTPAQAFDALYSFCAPALVRQAYLLTGRRALARESVERAFQLAWDRWPEVARDPDPAGWVRAAAYEWALSPWHRYRRRHRRPEPPPSDDEDRMLLETLLRLPPPYRRTLLLYDGLGLGLPETAAETEASTRAAAGRLTYARETVAARLPELSDPDELQRRLAELACAGRPRVAEPPAVRGGSERRARFWTRAAVAFTVALTGATALTLYTAPTGYEPPVPPGETVRGVPPRMAPGPLSEDERELRDRLRRKLPRGPERLAPQAR